MKYLIITIASLILIGCTKPQEPQPQEQLNSWVVEAVFMRPIKNQGVKVSYNANGISTTHATDFTHRTESKELDLSIRMLQTNSLDRLNIKIFKNDTLVDEKTSSILYHIYK